MWEILGAAAYVGAAVVLGVALLSLAAACVRSGGQVGPAVLDWVLSVLRGIVWVQQPLYELQHQYPVSLTCQIPKFKSLSEIYGFAWGWKRDGVFVEVGAYDGESFSNTSCLADLGWRGHYVEPVPKFAAACRARHSGNRGVHVHQYAVSDRASSGQTLEISPAGPFSSSSQEEIDAFATMPALGVLRFFGWQHGAEPKVSAQMKSLEEILAEDCGIEPLAAPPTTAVASTGASSGGRASARSSTPTRRAAGLSGSGSGSSDKASDGSATLLRPPTLEGGGVDVSADAWKKWAAALLAARDAGHVQFNIDLLVVDIEGMEWRVLSGFDLAKYRPRMIILEVQEKLQRYRDSATALGEAAALEALLHDAGYSILYRDVINTVFVHRAHRCHGEYQ
jgi:hypothetical protein